MILLAFVVAVVPDAMIDVDFAMQTQDKLVRNLKKKKIVEQSKGNLPADSDAVVRQAINLIQLNHLMHQHRTNSCHCANANHLP